MSPPELVVVGERVVLPDGVRPAALVVRQGAIAAIVELAHAPETEWRLDAGPLVVLPGLVDCHVHVNEPGRTEWEGFDTATRAAAAGGVCTIVDMPLNCIPVTTTLAALEVKRAAVEQLLYVDTAFWGGVVPGNAGELEPLVRAGARGFKAFMVHSGIDDFPAATVEDLRVAMPILARLAVPLLVHAEVACSVNSHPQADPRAYQTFLDSRPPEMENEAIATLIALAEETRCRVHIVHLSSAEALPQLAAAKARGVPITAETCPHYLCFAAEEIPDGHTEYKCAPPIRPRQNQTALWRALVDGTLDFVVSDHSPCTPALKLLEAGDFVGAWGGVASLQLGLAALWTRGQAEGVSLAQLGSWLSARPAALAGLDRKGALAVGKDADFVLWDPDAEFVVDGAQLFHRHKITPYQGRRLRGVVHSSYLRGQKIFDRAGDQTHHHGPFGRTL